MYEIHDIESRIVRYYNPHSGVLASSTAESPAVLEIAVSTSDCMLGISRSKWLFSWLCIA